MADGPEAHIPAAPEGGAGRARAGDVDRGLHPRPAVAAGLGIPGSLITRKELDMQKIVVGTDTSASADLAVAAAADLAKAEDAELIVV